MLGPPDWTVLPVEQPARTAVRRTDAPGTAWPVAHAEDRDSPGARRGLRPSQPHSIELSVLADELSGQCARSAWGSRRTTRRRRTRLITPRLQQDAPASRAPRIAGSSRWSRQALRLSLISVGQDARSSPVTVVTHVESATRSAPPSAMGTRSCRVSVAGSARPTPPGEHVQAKHGSRATAGFVEEQHCRPPLLLFDEIQASAGARSGPTPLPLPPRRSTAAVRSWSSACDGVGESEPRSYSASRRAATTFLSLLSARLLQGASERSIGVGGEVRPRCRGAGAQPALTLCSRKSGDAGIELPATAPPVRALGSSSKPRSGASAIAGHRLRPRSRSRLGPRTRGSDRTRRARRGLW